MPLMGHFFLALTVHTQLLLLKAKLTLHKTKTFYKKSAYLFLGGTKKRDDFSGVSMETRTTFCKGIPEVGVPQALLFAC